MFLWARFAVSDVVDRICEGHQIGYEWLHRIVHTVPPELEDIYARIFQLMKDKDKKACGIVLALVDSAEETLELSELFEAMLIAGNNFRSLDENLTSKDLANFQLYLEAIGAGLIHCFTKIYAVRLVIHVTMIHKSVQTYLDSRGWKQLFGEQGVLVSHHELWLNICYDYLAGRRVKWVAPAPIHDGTCDVSLLPRGQAQLADCDPLSEGLYEYVHLRLLDHAYHYEQETAKSSWPLIQKVLSAQFVRDHIRINLKHRNSRYCVGDCALLPSDWSHNTALCSDVQLAVTHQLSLYVEEALQRHPEAFRSGSFVSAVVVTNPVFEALGEGPHSPKARLRHAKPFEEWIDLPLDGPRASPLATAVLWRCQLFTHSCPKFVLLLARHSSPLKDTDMLMAIRMLSTLEIEALLTQFPQCPLYLSSSLSDHDPDAISDWMEKPDETAVNFPYGPLFEVVRRDDPESIAEMLQLFLDRGEIINSRCGPKGTIFHSLAEKQLFFTEKPLGKEQLEVLFGVFISHGADINTTGPEGNVLEYVWKEAHVKYHRHPLFQPNSFTNSTELLIKMGATNSVCDPNGLIPSKTRMLAVAEVGQPSEHDVKYYFHGTCSDTQAETYRRQLDGLSLISSGRLSCPSPEPSTKD